jgi:hypothetical protein
MYLFVEDSMVCRLPNRSNQSTQPTAPLRNKSNVIATTPSTSSRFPASLVRLKLVRCPHSLAPTLAVLPSMSRRPPLHSLGSRTPAELLFNASRELCCFLPEKPPFGLPVYVARVDSASARKPHPFASAHPCRSYPSLSVPEGSILFDS